MGNYLLHFLWKWLDLFINKLTIDACVFVPKEATSKIRKHIASVCYNFYVIRISFISLRTVWISLSCLSVNSFLRWRYCSALVTFVCMADDQYVRWNYLRICIILYSLQQIHKFRFYNTLIPKVNTRVLCQQTYSSHGVGFCVPK